MSEAAQGRVPGVPGVPKLPRLGLRALFVWLGLLVLLLAGGGLFFFRIYDNQLIRQTESDLIGQGALLGAAYGRAWSAAADSAALDSAAASSSASSSGLFAVGGSDGPRPPRVATLALGRDDVRPPAPEAAFLTGGAEPRALAAGNTLRPLLEAAKDNTLVGVRVVDAAGVVVASSGSELGLGLGGREEVARALRGESVSLLRRRVSDHPAPPYSSLSRETGVRVFVAEPVRVAGRVVGAVVLSRTPMTLGKAFYQDRRSLLTMAIILVAAVLTVSLLAAALIVKPVRALIRQTEAVGRGRAGEDVAPIPRPGTREIAQLSHAVTSMARRLGERAAYLQGFAASVSHEFKTPLTSLQGTAELLRDHADDMSAAERARFLQNLEADSARLGRLVHRLLELARADMSMPGEAIAEVGAVLSALAQEGELVGVPVVWSAPQRLRLRMDEAACRAALLPFLENAHQHGGPGVRLTLAAEVVGPWVRVQVSDDGPGVSSANAARVFEPFFTTARERGGTGMGLTIAQALIRAHGGHVELVPAERGAAFAVFLPATDGD